MLWVVILVDVETGNSGVGISVLKNPNSHWLFWLKLDLTGTNFVLVNKKGSCKRNICECDKAFASNLKANENLWLFQNSQYSGFDQRANCLARISTPGGGGGHVEECCGEYPNRWGGDESFWAFLNVFSDFHTSEG